MSVALLPHGGGSLSAQAWLEVIDADYLRTFVRDGGSAVKVVVAGSDQTGSTVAGELKRRATSAGLAFADVDAATTRVHLIDQLFGSVSRQLDWPRVARAWLRRAYSEAAISDLGDELDIGTVARDEGWDPRELHRTVRLCLQGLLLSDVSLPRDLRTAVLRLAQAGAGFPESRSEDTAWALAWLRGEPTPLSALRRLGINTRVMRSSARSVLVGLGAILAGSDEPGLQGMVVCIDARRLAVGRRPVTSERSEIHYSRAAVLDAWEVLRQLIDATEAMTGMLVVVTVPPELVVDETRGLPAYSALQLRVADEVRDRRRANPYAAMVRLDVRLEAVPGLAP